MTKPSRRPGAAVSPRKPRRAVVLAGRGRRGRKQIGQRRFGRPRPATVRCRLLAVVGRGRVRRRRRRACVHFGVGLPLHVALVGAHVGDRHRYPIVDPRERLPVTEQQYLADSLRERKRKKKHKLPTISSRSRRVLGSRSSSFRNRKSVHDDGV